MGWKAGIEEDYALRKTNSISSSSNMNNLIEKDGVNGGAADNGYSDGEIKLITVLRRKIMLAKAKGNQDAVKSLTRKLESRQQQFLRRQEEQVQFQKLKQYSRPNGTTSYKRRRNMEN